MIYGGEVASNSESNGKYQSVGRRSNVGMGSVKMTSSSYKKAS